MKDARTIIIDSSVTMKWLCTEEELHVEQAECLLRDMRAGEIVGTIPELSLYELGNALLKGKQVQPARAAPVIDFLYALPLSIISSSGTLAHVAYRIAHERRITFYDAVFLALAKTLSAPLITDNVRHQCRVPGVKVIPIAEYSSRARSRA